jgi:hypothetical protein
MNLPRNEFFLRIDAAQKAQGSVHLFGG